MSALHIAHDALDSFYAQFEALGEDWPRRSLVLVGMPNLSITICQSLTINLLYNFCAKAACEDLMHRPRLHAKGARDAVDALPRLVLLGDRAVARIPRPQWPSAGRADFNARHGAHMVASASVAYKRKGCACRTALRLFCNTAIHCAQGAQK